MDLLHITLGGLCGRYKKKLAVTKLYSYWNAVPNNYRILRKDLTRSAGVSLTNKPESDVLAAIKKLAIREENIMVAKYTCYSNDTKHMEAT